MILMLTQDLMMSSTVGSVARLNDEQLKTAGSTAAAAKMIESSQPRLLLVDLQTPALDIAGVASMLQSIPKPNRPRIVAYAQHVHKELLDEARNAGFDQILTRGQMNSNVAEILAC